MKWTTRRISVMFLLAMIALLALSLPQQHPITPTAHAQASYCEMAHTACYAQYRDHYTSCKILGGSDLRCLAEGRELYESCMVAHGCPSMLGGKGKE